MENNECTLMEKMRHLNGMIRRLSMPKPAHEGPRGRSQARALTQIALRDGITQKELMERLGIMPSSMSELMGKLEGAGLIERKTSEDDRRNVNIFITEDGRKKLEQCNFTSPRFDPFTALTDEEKETFDALMDKLITASEEECGRQNLPVHPIPPFGMCPPRAPYDGSFGPGNRPPFCPPRHGRGHFGPGPREGFRPMPRYLVNDPETSDKPGEEKI